MNICQNVFTKQNRIAEAPAPTRIAEYDGEM